MNLRLVLLPDAISLSLALADGLAALLRARPNATLLLPSGRTPQGAYAHLAQWVAEGKLLASKATVFALDEIVGLGPEDKDSFAWYHHHHVWAPWGLSKAQAWAPNGLALDPQAEALDYAAKLRAHAPLALALLGLGVNGHVAFNEPSKLHAADGAVVPLCPGSAGGAAWGITLGMASIGAAERLWVVASGPSKAVAVQRMLEGPLDPMCPASLLRIHPKLTLLLDREAASSLAQATLALAEAPPLL